MNDKRWCSWKIFKILKSGKETFIQYPEVKHMVSSKATEVARFKNTHKNERMSYFIQKNS